MAFQLVFSILGMQLFMGMFGSCSDPSITLQARPRWGLGPRHGECRHGECTVSTW